MAFRHHRPPPMPSPTCPSLPPVANAIAAPPRHPLARIAARRALRLARDCGNLQEQR
jgi:hypothetical protein